MMELCEGEIRGAEESPEGLRSPPLHVEKSVLRIRMSRWALQYSICTTQTDAHERANHQYWSKGNYEVEKDCLL